MIELYDGRYGTLAESATVVATVTVPAAGRKGGGSFQYWDFINTKPLMFDGVKDPIVAMRWI